MSLTELYPWLKALHVASAIIFVGGVLSVSVFLAAVARSEAETSAVAMAIRRWDQAVTSPAMLLVWALGLAMALDAGWFTNLWLQAKLVFVVILSAVHGVQSGRLRRLAGGAGRWRREIRSVDHRQRARRGDTRRRQARVSRPEIPSSPLLLLVSVTIEVKLCCCHGCIRKGSPRRGAQRRGRP